MTREPADRIEDILDAIRVIRSAQRRMETAEVEDDVELTDIAFDAILHNLTVIGEATKALPDALLASRSDVPWSEIAKQRDFITHHYHRIESVVVRRTIDAPLTALETACLQLLDDLR